MADKCTHGQLYVHIKVTVAILIEHNSAAAVSGARDQLHDVLNNYVTPNFKFDSCMNIEDSPDID